jgi:hypothetical protein
VASHASAAWLWGLIDQPPDKPEVTVSWPRQHGRHVKGIRLHQSKDILDRAVTVRRTIRVTNPIRTLVDLGASVSLEQLADAIDRAVARKLVSIAALLADATTTAAHALTLQGWVILVYSWRDITQEPARVAREIAEAYRNAVAA